MIEARWFSTVRWLMPRSAAMFLLGWPASTRSITSRCRGVRPARWVAADSRHSCNLLEFLRQFERPLDAGDQFLAADRLFDEIQRARLHRFDRHRHVAVAGDHDRGQAMAVVMELAQQFEPAHSRQIGVDQQAGGMDRDERPRETLRSSNRFRRCGRRPPARRASPRESGRRRRRRRSWSGPNRLAVLQPGEPGAARSAAGGLARSFSIACVNSLNLTGLLN